MRLPSTAHKCLCYLLLFAYRTTEHILKLEDPNSLEEDMGVIVLNLSLVVKQGDFKRHVSMTLLFFSKFFIAIVLW